MYILYSSSFDLVDLFQIGRLEGTTNPTITSRKIPRTPATLVENLWQHVKL
jgi:hypothetical protein